MLKESHTWECSHLVAFPFACPGAGQSFLTAEFGIGLSISSDLWTGDAAQHYFAGGNWSSACWACKPNIESWVCGGECCRQSHPSSHGHPFPHTLPTLLVCSSSSGAPSAPGAVNMLQHLEPVLSSTGLGSKTALLWKTALFLGSVIENTCLMRSGGTAFWVCPICHGLHANLAE